MASSPGHGQQARAQQRRALALADVAPDDDVDAAGLVFEGDKDCETSYKDRDGKYRGQRGVPAAKT